THWYCGSLFWVQAIPAQECHEIIQNRLAFLGEESVCVGHGGTAAGSIRSTHSCASISSGMTEFHCAARCTRQSMTARLPSDRMRSCRLPRSAPSGCWHCGTLCPVSRSERKLATATP